MRLALFNMRCFPTFVRCIDEHDSFSQVRIPHVSVQVVCDYDYVPAFYDMLFRIKLTIKTIDMNKQLQLFMLVIVMALAAVDVSAESFFKADQSVFNKPYLTDMSYNVKKGTLTFTEGDVPSASNNLKRYFKVHFYFNNSKVTLSESFGSYDYVMAKDVTVEVGESLDVDRMAYISEGLEMDYSKAITQTVASSFGKKGTVHTINISEGIKKCNDLGFYDIMLFVEPYYQLASSELAAMYTTSESDIKLWMSNRLDLTLSPLDVKLTYIQKELDGTYVGETGRFVMGDNIGEVKCSYKGKVCYVSSNIFRRYKKSDDTYSSAVNASGSELLIDRTRNVDVNVFQSMVFQPQSALSVNGLGAKYYASYDVYYYDPFGNLIQHNFGTEQDLSVDVAYLYVFDIAKGTSYSFNDMTYKVANNDIKELVEFGGSVYVEVEEGSCSLNKDEIVTAVYKTNGYETTSTTKGIRVTNKGGYSKINTHKDVNVKVVDGFTNDVLMDETVQCSVYTYLPNAPVHKGMNFKKYSCDGYDIVGNGFEPTSDVVVTIEYEDALVSENPSATLAYTLDGGVEVASNYEKGMSDPGVYGHLGLMVRIADDGFGHYYLLSGEKVASLTEESMPTSLWNVKSEYVIVTMNGQELTVMADAECDVCVYQLNGICVAEARVAGSVNVDVPAKGVYNVVVHRNSQIVHAQKVTSLQ